MQQSETVAHESRRGLHAPKWIVVVGANTGGPQALAEILPRLPVYVHTSIIVLQKMRPGFSRVLAEQLAHVCSMPVCEAEDGQALQPSRILIAPGSSRIIFQEVGTDAAPAYTLLVDNSDPDENKQLRVDISMKSAAQVFGRNTIAILLSGLGTDGVEGMQAVASAGGLTLAQDEASSIVHDLPGSAIRQQAASDVLPLWNIADRMTEIVGGSANAVAA